MWDGGCCVALEIIEQSKVVLIILFINDTSDGAYI